MLFLRTTQYMKNHNTMKNNLITKQYIAGCILLAFALLLPGESAEGTQLCWIGAVISGLGSLFGGIAGNIQARNQVRAIDRQMEQAKKQRDAVMNEDTMARADSQNLLGQTRKILEERSRVNQTNSIRGGYTNEAKIAQANSDNKALADATSQIMAQAQRRQDAAENRYQSTMADLMGKRAALAGSGAQALASGIAGAASNIGEMADDLIDERKKKRENNTLIK